MIESSAEGVYYPMKIFITGATGYVGQQMTKSFLDKGHEIFCLVRKGSEYKLGDYLKRVHIIYGDVLNISDLVLENIDAVIHLVAILIEDNKNNITYEKLNYQSVVNIISLAKEYNINRFLYMSSAGAPPFISGYIKNKLKAENDLKSSNLIWTIFKPSLIYGERWLGKSMGWIALFKWFFKVMGYIPLIGTWFQRWTPISRTQISKAFLRALEDKSYHNKILMGKDLFEMIGD